MKHIVIREADLDLNDFIKDYASVAEDLYDYQCKMDELKRLSVTEKVTNGSVIVCVKSGEGLYNLDVLREKFPFLKITLVAQDISEDQVKRLQYEEEVIDLFFKAPLDFTQYEFMVTALVSEETKLMTSSALDLPATPSDELEIERSGDTETVKISKEDHKQSIIGKIKKSKETFVQKLEDFVAKDEADGVSKDLTETIFESSANDEILLEGNNVEQEEDFSKEIKELIQYKDDKFLKIINRNETLEDENKQLQSDIVKLEERLSTAQRNFEQKEVDYDQLKIKASIHDKRQTSQTEKLLEKIDYLNEKVRILTDKNKDLLDKNKDLSKKNVFDHKRVKLKEEALKEKIELIKDDVASQIQNRERRIINLKRKIDLLDFDLKDSVDREKAYLEKISGLEEKLYSLKKTIGDSLEDLDQKELQILKKAN